MRFLILLTVIEIVAVLALGGAQFFSWLDDTAAWAFFIGLRTGGGWSPS